MCWRDRVYCCDFKYKFLIVTSIQNIVLKGSHLFGYSGAIYCTVREILIVALTVVYRKILDEALL